MKKLRSKWTRIGVEGATTDGRKIERSWIEQMAAQYDPNTYGARISCEHIKSSLPSSEFGAYGDVLALKAEEAEIAGKKKLALFAQLAPNAALLDLNKRGQKVYTSMEVSPKFADTGKAYLINLAVTDSPASLGTQALAFSAQHNIFNSRKQDPENLFSAAEETLLEFEEISDPSAELSKVQGLFSRVLETLGKGKEKAAKDDQQFSELSSAVLALAQHGQEQATAFAALQQAQSNLDSGLSALRAEIAAFQQRLETTPAPSFQQRPTVSGPSSDLLATF